MSFACGISQATNEYPIPLGIGSFYTFSSIVNKTSAVISPAKIVMNKPRYLRRVSSFDILLRFRIIIFHQAFSWPPFQCIYKLNSKSITCDDIFSVCGSAY